MMHNMEEGKGLLENTRQGPDLWRERLGGGNHRFRNYSASKDNLNLNSDTLAKEKYKGDARSDVSARDFVFSDDFYVLVMVCVC